MYIDNSGHRYYRGTEQHCSRAPFLILCQLGEVKNPFYPDKPLVKENREIRALVRKVAMHQCGHWMMGRARAFGHTLTLSGSYGGDGLPIDVPKEVYDRATPVPQELVDAWNKGGGWNSAGSEAPAMAKWAVETLIAPQKEKSTKRNDDTRTG